MGIGTNVQLTSPMGALNRQDLKRWLTNAEVFLLPLAAIYLGGVISVISAPGHVITLHDFVPSLIDQGAMVLYVLNCMQDLIRKLLADNPS